MLPPELDLALPAVDEHIVASESRYEIEDGKVVYVPPADEPHGTAHIKLGALLDAHRAAGFAVAADMLTRTSRIDDIAPDVSVYPSARDPRTGGRQIEQLAFEITSTQSLAHVARRAAKLVGRGVRRVFAIDLERGRALEWVPALGEWSILDVRSYIDDPALALPLPVAALLDAALADHAIVHAYRRQQHPEFVAERAEGRAEAMIADVIAVLGARGLSPTPAELERIHAERDPDRLRRWLVAAVTAGSIAAMLGA